jgi:hypothetical protein
MVRGQKGIRRRVCVFAATAAVAPAQESVPAWHEGRHHQRRRGGKNGTGDHEAPRLEGQVDHRGVRELRLTLVATGRCAGGGEAGRSRGSRVVGVEGDGGAEQRKQGRRGTWLRSVLELPRAVLWLREVGGEPAVGLRAFFSPPPPPSPAGRGRVERGGLPVAARVGAAPRRGGGLLIGQGGARDAWTARMAPAGSDGCQAGGAARKAVATTEKGKKRRVTGGRRGDAGGDVTRVPPGGDPARAR